VTPRIVYFPLDTSSGHPVESRKIEPTAGRAVREGGDTMAKKKKAAKKKKK
jgi:hypothetical protein